MDKGEVAVLAEGLFVLLDDGLEGRQISDADSDREVKVGRECVDHSLLLEDGLLGDLSDQELHDAQQLLSLCFCACVCVSGSFAKTETTQASKKEKKKKERRRRKKETNGDFESEGSGLRSLPDRLRQVAVGARIVELNGRNASCIIQASCISGENKERKRERKR